jgi:SAM-dependent methyltransferase
MASRHRLMTTSRLPPNLDARTVAGFGDEWTRFDQSALSESELRRMFERYFRIFPWSSLPPDAVGFDLGCGSGRWSLFVAERVGTLHCIDASPAALEVARKRLAGRQNCRFHLASTDDLALADGSMDFGLALGVLHLVPRPEDALAACVAKLKPGAPFLLYLYYAFDNRPSWYRWLWRVSDLVRRGVSRLPYPPRYGVSQLLACLAYWPLARLSRVAEWAGLDVSSIPLSLYRHSSFYTMRTDALDRFGTRLERRFTASEIREMTRAAGLDRLAFSASPPYWCVVGYRA